MKNGWWKKIPIASLLVGLVGVVSVAAWFKLSGRGGMQPDREPSIALMQDWHNLALKGERFTEGFRGPVAARMYAYSGIAAWEAALPALPKTCQSLSFRFKGLAVPPPEPGAKYHLPTVLNACYHTVFEGFFLSSPQHVTLERNKIYESWQMRLQKQVDPSIFDRSTDYGKLVGQAVFDWSATDSLGHLANHHNYDRAYKPSGEYGKWKPCADFPMPPLLPYWGRTRTFVVDLESTLAAPPPRFSTSPGSPYQDQALEVYTISRPLSAENEWIADFWSDDFAGLTFSPAGRWISIANQAIAKAAPPADRALETYLLAGLAMSDALVSCWNSKYHYNLLRPETYIREVYDPAWRSLHHTPSFPGYPSGHAMIGGAVAEVLTVTLGQNFEMTDRSHEGRTEFNGRPRHFSSFYEMAFENAFSRIALGVHFRMDCEEGNRLGLLIGREVCKLPTRQHLQTTFR